MAENSNFKCTGNCLNCLPAQRGYCASQHAYSNMKVLDMMMGMLKVMQGDINILSEKIEAIQNNEAAVFDPTHEDEATHQPIGQPAGAIAQKGDGAPVDPQIV